MIATKHNHMVCRIAMLSILLAAAALGGGQKLEFTYALGFLQNGKVIPAPRFSAFLSGERFRLRLLPKQDSYYSVAVGRSDGSFELVPAMQCQESVRAGKWAELPRSGWFRLDEEPGVDMMYLILTSRRVPEIEELRRRGRFPESALLEIRDLYYAGAFQERDSSGGTVRMIRRQAGNSRPVVVLEPISLRHR